MNLHLTDFGGTGPLLALGPSLGTSAESLWGRCAHQLINTFHVVGWDLPGHGHSLPADHYELNEVADAVLAALDDAGASGPFRYAGDSIGGAVGLCLLLTAPQRVAHAALVCSAAKFGDGEAWRERAATVRASGTAALLDTAPARWFAPGFVEREPAVASALLADLTSADDASYAAACDALATFDVTAELASIDTPLLAIAGADDVATPPDVVAVTANAVRRCYLVVLDGVAHLAPAEAPQRVADLLTEVRPRMVQEGWAAGPAEVSDPAT